MKNTNADAKPAPHGQNRIQKAAHLMNQILQRLTGLEDLARKIVVYYALATHAIERLNRFPILVLKGQMGTGKSATLVAIAQFAYRPNSFDPIHGTGSRAVLCQGEDK